MRGAGIAFVVSVLVGCSDGEPGGATPDAGPDAGHWAPEPPRAPQIPWLADGVPAIAPPGPPAFSPCPAGWRAVTDDDVATCDPYAEGGPVACAAGLAHFPGELGCSQVGRACPSGEWADDLPTTGTVYVRAGEPAGGDGSRGRPFGTVVDALRAVSAGGTVALSRGSYDESIRLPPRVVLRGACAAETTLTTSAASASAVVVVATAGGELRDLQLGPARVPAVSVTGAGHSVHLEGVAVQAASLVGLLAADGASLTARSVVVRDTQSRASDRGIGRGLDVEAGATAEVSRAIFERNRLDGVFASGAGTSVTLADVVVRDTLSQESDQTRGHGLRAERGANVVVTNALFERNRFAAVYFAAPDTHATLEAVLVRDTAGQESDSLLGRGLAAIAGATAEVRRALFVRNRETGVDAFGAGTNVALEDVVVRDTQADASDGMGGSGLSARDGARVAVTRAVLAGNRRAGVFAADPGTELTLVDVVVRDTRSRQADQLFGMGLAVQGGCVASATRALFAGNRAAGVLATGSDASLRLEDAVVRDTQSQQGDRAYGRGLAVELGASLEALRTLAEGNRDVGVSAIGAGATLRLEDVVVRATLGREVDGTFGRGLGIEDGARAEIARTVVEGNRGSGIFVGLPGAYLRLEDAVVRDTQSLQSDQRFGRGLAVQQGATAEIARTRFERNREVGIYAYNSGTGVQAQDVVVLDTRPAECGDRCAQGAGGMGVGSYSGATMSLTRFVVARSELCGAQIALGGELDLVDGEVRASAFGACVQVPGYRLSRLNASVVYVDNGANLEATDFPVPDVVDAVGGL